MHIDEPLPRVAAARARYPGFLPEVKGCDLVYADDVVGALDHGHPEVVNEAAHRMRITHTEEPGELGMHTAEHESGNFLLSPAEAPEGLFRRDECRPLPNGAQRGRKRSGKGDL